MPSYNRVVLAGNLTRDPELKYTPQGKAVARLGLALNHKWKTEAGEMKEEVTFVDIDAWGKQAETIAQYLKKGSPLLMEGRLKLDSWEKDGQKHSKLKIVLESFTFIGGGDKQERSEAPASKLKPSPQQETTTEEDNVPF